MARYEVKFTSQYEGEVLEEKVLAYLKEKKFLKAKYKDEVGVYQIGSGFWTAPKFVTYKVNGHEVVVQAWIKNFAMFGESGVTGFVGMIPKRQLKALVDEMEPVIK